MDDAEKQVYTLHVYATLSSKVNGFLDYSNSNNLLNYTDPH